MFSHVSYRGGKLCRTITSYESPLSRINKGQLRTSPFHSESKKTIARFLTLHFEWTSPQSGSGLSDISLPVAPSRSQRNKVEIVYFPKTTSA